MKKSSGNVSLYVTRNSRRKDEEMKSNASVIGVNNTSITYVRMKKKIFSSYFQQWWRVGDLFVIAFCELKNAFKKFRN